MFVSGHVSRQKFSRPAQEERLTCRRVFFEIAIVTISVTCMKRRLHCEPRKYNLEDQDAPEPLMKSLWAARIRLIPST